MRTIVMLGPALVMAAVMATAAEAWETDAPAPVTVKAPPGASEIKVTVKASEGATEQDIAEGIAAENAKRDPAAQEASRIAKRKAESDEAHQKRVSKICESISEKAMEDDPSLRRMCGE